MLQGPPVKNSDEQWPDLRKQCLYSKELVILILQITEVRKLMRIKHLVLHN